VILELQQCFVAWYRRLNEPAGGSDIVRAWSEHSSYADGKEIIIKDADTEFCGTTRGLTLDGALKVELETGEIKIVRAGDVSLRSG
jgi:biotin-(acetyl-CoA carboxylase) ligase